MASIRNLIRKNIDRGRHWLPFVPERTRELILIAPSLFCLGEDQAGIFSQPTCTPRQYHLLRKHLGRNPGIAVSRLPDYVLIESLMAIPRPSVVSPDRFRLDLVIIPTNGAPHDRLESKVREITAFYRQNGLAVSTHILQAALPPLVLLDVMRLGVVLAGRHPVIGSDDDTDMGISVGEMPRIIRDGTSLRPSEWNPFQHILDREVNRVIEDQGYRPYLRASGVNPFFTPSMPVLVHYEEALDAEMLLCLRLSMGALFSRFGPTREAMQEIMKAWGLDERQVPDMNTMDLAGAIRMRNCYVAPEAGELPVFSWPSSPAWHLARATLDWDGSGWRLMESDLFGHRHAWVLLAWAAIAGLIGRDTTLRAPEGLMLKPDAAHILSSMTDTLALGTDIIASADARQGSIRFKDGRFFYSDTPYALLDQGCKTILDLFIGMKKKALLDDRGL